MRLPSLHGFDFDQPPSWSFIKKIVNVTKHTWLVILHLLTWAEATSSNAVLSHEPRIQHIGTIVQVLPVLAVALGSHILACTLFSSTTCLRLALQVITITIGPSVKWDGIVASTGPAKIDHAYKV